jgi:hypothetical protein
MVAMRVSAGLRRSVSLFDQQDSKENPTGGSVGLYFFNYGVIANRRITPHP